MATGLWFEKFYLIEPQEQFIFGLIRPTTMFSESKTHQHKYIFPTVKPSSGRIMIWTYFAAAVPQHLTFVLKSILKWNVRSCELKLYHHLDNDPNTALCLQQNWLKIKRVRVLQGWIQSLDLKWMLHYVLLIKSWSWERMYFLLVVTKCEHCLTV